ncbi:DUF5660 domain-containing protein [Patescibacteria group bacterium]|nr:DUF5660 domain-containing protein [Patescibacteria group bacterium]
MDKTKTQKNRIKNFDRNPVEALRDTGSVALDATRKALQDEAQLEVNALWNQLLGASKQAKKEDIKHTSNEGPVGQNDFIEMREGEEIVLGKSERMAEIEPAIDYFSEIINATERASSQEQRELSQKIEEVRVEIAKLAKSSTELEVIVKDVTIENIIPNAGKYHLNFFEWLLVTLQSARIKIEDSTSWLTVISAKTHKKGYWPSAKAYGTSFTLSGERNVATQVG